MTDIKINARLKVAVIASTVILTDAPKDGKLYGRKDGEWKDISVVEDVTDAIQAVSDKVDNLQEEITNEVWPTIEGNTAGIKDLGEKVDKVDAKADEAIKIASGKSTVHIYDTAAEMYADLLSDVSKTKFKLGDDLLTRSEEDPDYWISDENTEWSSDTGWWVITPVQNSLEAYQKKEDNNLITTDKTVVGAINELSDLVDTKQTEQQVKDLISNASIRGNQVVGAVAEADTAKKTEHKLSFASKSFDGSEDVTINKADLKAIMPPEVATDTELGSIKTGYSQSGNNYAIKVDEDGRAYVEIAVGDVYKAGQGLAMESTTFYIPTDGVVSDMIKSLSINKVFQPEDTTIVLSGGNATGWKKQV